MTDERTPLSKWGETAREACWPLLSLSLVVRFIDWLLHHEHAHGLLVGLRWAIGVIWVVALAVWGVAYVQQRARRSRSA